MLVGAGDLPNRVMVGKRPFRRQRLSGALNKFLVGLRVEDNFFVTADGAEKLSSFPDDFR